jgi:hypothetical protein
MVEIEILNFICRYATGFEDEDEIKHSPPSL